MRTAPLIAILALAVLSGLAPAQVFRPGDLAVTNYQPPGLFRVDRAGVATAVPGASSALRGPSGVTTTPDGAVLVADFTANAIVRFEASGSSAPLVLGLGGPIRLAAERDGSVIVTEISPPRISRIFHGTAIPLVTFASALQRPFGVCIEPDGNIVFTTDRTPGLYRLDAQTSVVTPIAVGAPFQLPQGVALFPNGDFAVIDGVTDSVFRVDRSTGTVTTWVSNPSLAGNPEGIVPTNDGGFLIAQSGASNNRIAFVDAAGGSGTFTQGAPFSNIEDCALVHELRGPAYPLNTGPGAVYSLDLDFGPGAGLQIYSIAFAFDLFNGIQLIGDPRSFTIDADGLFLATFFTNIPPLFVSCTGLLDPNGQGTATVDLQSLPPGFLTGATLWAQAFDLVPPGPYGGLDFGDFSNAIPLSFQ